MWKKCSALQYSTGRRPFACSRYDTSANLPSRALLTSREHVRPHLHALLSHGELSHHPTVPHVLSDPPRWKRSEEAKCDSHLLLDELVHEDGRAVAIEGAHDLLHEQPRRIEAVLALDGRGSGRSHGRAATAAAWAGPARSAGARASQANDCRQARSASGGARPRRTGQNEGRSPERNNVAALLPRLPGLF